MPKLNLIIADVDESYLWGVTKYITENQSNKFNIYSFSKKSNLEDFISQDVEIIDILLVSPELFNEGFIKRGISNIAILSSGRLPSDFQNYKIINKYQLGDSLVRNVLNLFLDESTDLIIQNGEKHTRIISAFSPIGGSGKTTISYGCALKCAQRGRKVFYLNFESIPSTSVFFEARNEFNLSHIFYYLKAKHRNLSLKIESTRQEDTYSSIHYFAPPKRLMDMSDIEPLEYVQLIRELKAMNWYDVIFIDLSASLDKKNISILSESDEVLFVLTPEISSYTRTQQTIKELEFIYESERMDVLSKITPILNKNFNECSAEIQNIRFGEKGISVRIPKVSPLVTRHSGRAFLNINSIFGEALDEIVSRL